MKKSLHCLILSIALIIIQSCYFSFEDSNNQLTIVIDSKDKISIDDKEISLERLRTELRTFLEKEIEDRSIQVEYSRKSKYETFVSVLDTVYEEWTAFRDQVSNREFGENYDQLTKK